MQNKDKKNIKTDKLKFGLKRNLLLLKEFNPKKAIKALLLPLKTKVGLEKEGITQNLGKKVQKILIVKMVILNRKKRF
jgi:hypothetical protein